MGSDFYVHRITLFVDNRSQRGKASQKQEHKMGGRCNNPRAIMAAGTWVAVLEGVRSGQILARF